MGQHKNKLRFWVLFSLCLATIVSLSAQDVNNPFELSPRLAPSSSVETSAPTEGTDTTTANPFDLDRPGQTNALSNSNNATDTAANPFDVIAPDNSENIKLEQAQEPNTQQEISTAHPKEESPGADGSLLLITLIVLSAATLSFIFFRGVYLKAYRALFNDNLLSQLYREREAGAFGIFLITYAVFFIATGFFIVLALPQWGYTPTDSLWTQFLHATLIVSSLMAAKHLILAIIGYVFPVQKETSRYSFTIMVFAIVIGLFLTVATVVLAYIPAEYTKLGIYLCLGTFLLLYLLRSFRGLFIANRFIFNYQFHFLSYICAVEIGPALCLFKFLTDF